jgi:hypothetical protein
LPDAVHLAEDTELAETAEATRLDRLWQAVAASDAEADWLRFYEGFATARLIVPLAAHQPGEETRLQTLELESGEVALAFDTEARFDAFFTGPTDFLGAGRDQCVPHRSMPRGRIATEPECGENGRPDQENRGIEIHERTEESDPRPLQNAPGQPVWLDECRIDR